MNEAMLKLLPKDKPNKGGAPSKTFLKEQILEIMSSIKRGHPLLVTKQMNEKYHDQKFDPKTVKKYLEQLTFEQKLSKKDFSKNIIKEQIKQIILNNPKQEWDSLTMLSELKKRYKDQTFEIDIVKKYLKQLNNRNKELCVYTYNLE